MKNKQTKKWKPKYDEKYWFINIGDFRFYIDWNYWCGDSSYNDSNCFRTKKEAQQKLREIKKFLKNNEN